MTPAQEIVIEVDDAVEDEQALAQEYWKPIRAAVKDIRQQYKPTVYGGKWTPKLVSAVESKDTASSPSARARSSSAGNRGESGKAEGLKLTLRNRTRSPLPRKGKTSGSTTKLAGNDGEEIETWRRDA